jgi:beta-mannosidase
MLLRNWELCGFYPYVPELGKKFPKLGRSITDWIPAEVPGSVHYDLWKAGWIEDPYYGLNSLKCEWVENRWWMYRTHFDFNTRDQKRRFLHFEGLDYKAHIYLNDVLLGIHEGTFIPVTFEVTDKLKPERNELIVLFEDVPREDGQAGHTSHTKSQKSRFSYKWDFSTRMVPIGIWDEVYIKSTGKTRITETWLRPELRGNKGIVRSTVYYQQALGNSNEPFECKMDIFRNGKLISSKKEPCRFFDGNGSHTMELIVEQPEKWYPNGSGDQPLYQTVIQIWQGNELSDQWSGHIGFRDLIWIQNENAPAESLPYCLQVNGERVYIKGVNLTPFDMLIGTVTEEKYADFIKQIKDANINLVRVNGVGLIEKKVFYDLCDQAGILIWQEFIQTSSSMDRVPPKNADYLKLLSENSISALKSRRNHVSLACWSGGNELTDREGVAATFANENISFLKKLVDQYDPGRYFIPTSATGPNEFLRIDQPGLNHDVHGPWNYGGPEEYYDMYNRSDSLLHGELGAEGMSSVESLRRFLPESELVVTSMSENVIWRHHGDWWDTYDRDTAMFGNISDLSAFVTVSQFIQAEGMRYALESNRRRKYQNSGSMIWAFNEPFPNVSNTCLVDYYGSPKMSYYWVRKAYAGLHMSLKYDKLYYRPGETFHAESYIHNSLHARSVYWKIQCLDLRGNVFWETQDTTMASANSTTPGKAFSIDIDAHTPEIFMVRILFADQESANGNLWDLDVVHSNEYLFSTINDPIFKPLMLKKAPELKWDMISSPIETDEGRIACTYRVKNEGDEAALFVKTKVDPNCDFVFCPQNYSTLFPGESMKYEISWKTKKGFSPRVFFESW